MQHLPVRSGPPSTAQTMCSCGRAFPCAAAVERIVQYDVRRSRLLGAIVLCGYGFALASTVVCFGFTVTAAALILASFAVFGLLLFGGRR